MRSSLTNDGTTYAASRSTRGCEVGKLRQIMIRDGIALAERTLAAMLAYAQTPGPKVLQVSRRRESPR